MMQFLRAASLGAALCLPLVSVAETPIKAVASFSILADWVQRVGGSAVEVQSLVPAGGDAHAFQPSPAQAREVAQAEVLFSVGLGFEGWLERFAQTAGFQGTAVVVSEGITPLEAPEDDHGHGHGHGHSHGHDHGEYDPHVWQDVALARKMVERIQQTLCELRPSQCAVFAERATEYDRELAALDAEIRALLAPIPTERRIVVTAHHAFAYFGAAYDVQFLGVHGLSSAAQPSARVLGRLIRTVREKNVQAIFAESITDRRQIEQIARETGLEPSGTLYSDSLSLPNGNAADYLGMMRHNATAIASALSQ